MTVRIKFCIIGYPPLATNIMVKTLGDMEMSSSGEVKLSRIVRAGVKKFRYTYDFGDNWRHVIQIEKALELDPQVRYPRCVKGSRACPPEDCGGPGAA